MPYRAPLAEFRFLLAMSWASTASPPPPALPRRRPRLVEAILTGAGRLCEDVLAPLRRVGRHAPRAAGKRRRAHLARLCRGLPRAWPRAAGSRLPPQPDYGGMGLPITLATAVNDMMSAACLALQIGTLLTQGQIEALEHHASRRDQGALPAAPDLRANGPAR